MEPQSQSLPSPISGTSPGFSGLEKRFMKLQAQSTVSAVPFTITPASARSLSSNAPSPIASSLQSTPRTLSAKTSTQSLAAATPLELPEALISPSILSGDEVNPNFRQPGIIRRISRGAKDKWTRRRQSSSTRVRERSSGPLIRRRSDCKSNGSTGALLTDMSHEEGEEEAIAEPARVLKDHPFYSGEPSGLSPVESNPIGTAPVVPKELQSGIELVKIAKKGSRERYRFFLDADGSRVSWFSKRARHFYIDDIKEIRVGDDTKNYREEFIATEQEAECWFTIIYVDVEKSRTKPIHLVAGEKTEVSLWTTALENLSRHRVDLMTGLSGSEERESVIRAHWDREVNRIVTGVPRTEDEKSLDFLAIAQLARNLHINCSKATLKDQFEKADSTQSGRLNYEELRDFVRRLRERHDLKEVFSDLLSRYQREKGLTKDDLFGFLRMSQGIEASADPAKWSAEYDRRVREVRPKNGSTTSLGDSSHELMTFDAFQSFMVSKFCGVYHGPPQKANFDRPLNEYFISSSHNTYLMDRQLIGRASTEMYASALRLGCRCVELDCWDGPKGEPIVNHGRTMSQSAAFSDCVSTINRYAFDASPYPIILSLEVHCNAEQQSRMVQILTETFGPKMILPPLLAGSTSLPSPEDLKYKILVKVKTSESSRDLARQTTGEAGRKRSASSPYSRPTFIDNPVNMNLPPLSSPPSISPPPGLPPPTFSPAQRSMTATSASSGGEDSDIMAEQPSRKSRTSKITSQLAKLGVYMQGYKYRGFDSPESTRFNHVFSFAEGTAMNICKHPENKILFERHNVQYLSRVYPGGFRIKSSNFDPITYWRRGVQMVALSWQTYDEGMQINRAMFAAGTDRDGYVLKPEYLRASLTDSKSMIKEKLKIDKQLVKFSVKMISAQQLPRLGRIGSDDSINPFIEIQMFSADDQQKGSASAKGAGFDLSARDGVSGYGRPYRTRTKIIQDNGYNPIFNEEIELSLETRYPELVFVRWIVFNSPDGRTMGNNCPQLAVFTAKLSTLQQGYRHLPLASGEGEDFIFSSLFCKIRKEESIAVPNSQQHDSIKVERSLRSGLSSLIRRGGSSDREKDRDRERKEKSSLDERRASQETTSSVKV